MMSPFGRAISNAGLALALAAMLTASSGCGGGDKKNSDSAGTSSSSNSTKSESSPGSGTEPKSSAAKAETDERPTIGGVPLDVYFDNPLQVASDQRSIGGAPVAAVDSKTSDPAMAPGTAPTVEPEPKPKPPAASGGGRINWTALITQEDLEGEIQSIRNDLNSRLTNFGAYKRATLEIPVFASTLAFLAEIARRHDGDIKWKDKAHFIRKLGISMSDVASSSTAGVKNSYDEVNEAFLKISEILNNNEPAELPEAEVEADFGDFVAMGNLMQRLKRGEQWLLTNTGSEDNFNEKSALAKRETSIFMLISESFATEGFGYNEYEDFVGWTHEMRDAAADMNKAVDTKNFNEYDTLRSKISQKCTQCHGVYRNG
jgi:hypothetical protein